MSLPSGSGSSQSRQKRIIADTGEISNAEAGSPGPYHFNDIREDYSTDSQEIFDDRVTKHRRDSVRNRFSTDGSLEGGEPATTGTKLKRRRFEPVSPLNKPEGPESTSDASSDFDFDETIERDVDDGDAIWSSPSPKRMKRRYRYINRVKALPRTENKLKLQRKAEAQCALNDNTSDWPCCKRLQCFRGADMVILRAKRKQVLAASQQERKHILRHMLDENGHFYFNRKKVCTFFLVNAFGFSKDLQRSVKGTTSAPATGMVVRVPRIKVVSQQRDVIVSFVQDLAEIVGERMPDAQEIHLPFSQKKHVYGLFKDSFKSEFEHELKPPSFSYFVSVWNERLKNIKVRRLKRFTKCTDCEMNREALVRWSHNARKCQEILKLHRGHVNMVSMERAAYTSRARRPLREPARVCSIVIDGADQTSFGLPHFTHSVKSSRGHSLDVKLIGLLEHRPMPLLFLYTMTAQFETGANHIIEVVHRWINTKARSLQLPPIMLLQLDNCARENKNRYLFAYLESLVAWGVFVEIEVSFLPIGHTHCDIDQKFSCTSGKLKHNNAMTMEDLHCVLRESYTPRPSVTGIKRIANISTVLERQKVLSRVPSFLEYRYFKFSRSRRKQSGRSDPFTTCCVVKANCDEEWKPLFPNDSERGFLLRAPDIHKTPPYVLKKLKNKKEVLDRIDSEEARIGSPRKVQDLLRLVEEVYEGGSHPFHWNLNDCIEGRGMQGEFNRHIDHDESNIDLTAYIPVTKVDYVLNTFVAVAPLEPTEKCPFWIAKVESLVMNKFGDVSGLNVRWYETSRGQNVFSGTYTPSYKKNGSHSIPWFGEVNTDAVFCQIDSLTRSNRLGATAVRRIREVVKCKSFLAK